MVKQHRGCPESSEAHLELSSVGGGVDNLLTEAHVLGELLALLQAGLHGSQSLPRNLGAVVEEVLNDSQLRLRQRHEQMPALKVEEVQCHLHIQAGSMTAVGDRDGDLLQSVPSALERGSYCKGFLVHAPCSCPQWK